MDFSLFIVSVYIQLIQLCVGTIEQSFTVNEAGRIRFNGKINIQIPTVWIKDVSFVGCVDACKLRLSCTAVNYHRNYNLCELDLEPSPGVVSTKESTVSYWIKPTEEDSVVCGTQSCNHGYVCNIQENKCEVKECSPLSVSNPTLVVGNINAAKGTINMRCYEGFVAPGLEAITLTCGTDGVWSPGFICTPASRYVIIPEGSSGDVTCPTDLKISVYYAYYGNDETGTNQNCIAANSSTEIKNACHNKQQCFLMADNAVYGDPCSGMAKHIEMKFYCVWA